MAQPANVHVSVPLTNLSIAHLQDLARFFQARTIFPVVPSNHKSDLYYKISAAETSRDQMAKRAPGAEAATVGWSYTTEQFRADPHALRHDIPDQIRSDADPAIRLDSDATMILTEQAMIREEKNWTDTYMVTGVWSSETTLSGADQWDETTSNPIADLLSLMTQVHLKSRRRPNTLAIPQDVWDVLKDNEDFLDRVKYGQSPEGVATVKGSDLAAILELDRVVVMGGVVNTAEEVAPENPQPDTPEFMGTKNVWLGYVAPSPGLMTPSAGYTFTWRNFLGDASGLQIKQYRDEKTECDIVEAASAWDQKLVSADCGALIIDAIP